MTKYISGLNGIRAIAVLMVIVYHRFPADHFLKIMPIGHFGVDIFFVLSGYLISRILLNGVTKIENNTATSFQLIKSFVIRRSLRIFPIYYLRICNLLSFIMIKFFKIVAWLEGASLLLLFTNMLIIKPINLEIYKMLLFPIGMAHGVLFIAYVILAFVIQKEQKWSFKDLMIVQLASLLPFATFYIEKKYVKNV